MVPIVPNCAKVMHGDYKVTHRDYKVMHRGYKVMRRDYKDYYLSSCTELQVTPERKCLLKAKLMTLMTIMYTVLMIILHTVYRYIAYIYIYIYIYIYKILHIVYFIIAYRYITEYMNIFTIRVAKGRANPQSCSSSACCVLTLVLCWFPCL